MNLIQVAQAKIRGLEYDFRHYTLEGFIKHIETFTGRKIKLFYKAMPPGRTGAWISDGEGEWEFIFIASNKPLIIQQLSIFHEVGHLLLGHSTLVVTRAELVNQVQNLQLVRWRSTRVDIEDKEAEAFALLIQKELLQHARYSDLSGIENFADAVGMI